jgi:hypothetical protein
MKMKRDTLFKHKASTVTYEEILADAKKYKNLLKSPKKLKKAPTNTRTERVCGFFFIK